LPWQFLIYINSFSRPARLAILILFRNLPLHGQSGPAHELITFGIGLAQRLQLDAKLLKRLCSDSPIPSPASVLWSAYQ
jgi:hypothetical protein